MTEVKPERIAKVIARSGLCSRRDAERWIESGRVQVNGETLTTPAHTVTEQDQILVDGNPLSKPQQTRLWAFHKPRGVITTHYDPEGRPTLFEILPPNLPDHIISVGRLDLMSEGLILLTNDGEFARKLEHPSSNVQRTYRVRVYGDLGEQDYGRLRNGISFDGIDYGPVSVEIKTHKRPEHWVEMTLHEGKNREIRRIVDHLGGRVTRLVRTSYGPFHLGKLEEGELREIDLSHYKAFVSKVS